MMILTRTASSLSYLLLFLQIVQQSRVVEIKSSQSYLKLEKSLKDNYYATRTSVLSGRPESRLLSTIFDDVAFQRA